MDDRTKREEYEVYVFDGNLQKTKSFNWKDEDEKRKFYRNLTSEIGSIIIEFSSLEESLENFLTFCLCNSEVNKEIIYHEIFSKSFKEKNDLLKKTLEVYYNRNVELFNSTMPNFSSKLREIIYELNIASNIRNKYAHAKWFGINEEKIVETKTSFKLGNIVKEYIKFDYQDLDKDFNKIFEINNNFSDFYIKILDCIENLF